MKESKYDWEILAVTRFVLALIVLTGHLTVKDNTGFFKWISFFGSFEAILGFLLISGLSISKSLKRNATSYFKRRIQRIYPVYLASIALVYIVDPTTFSLGFITTLAINLVFLNQFLVGISYVGPAWTLALEVWLYALAPFLYKLSFKQLLSCVYISFIAYCIYTCGRTLFAWDYFAGTRWGVNIILLSFIWLAGFALGKFDGERKKITKIVAGIFAIHWAITFAIQCMFRVKHNELQMFLEKDLIKHICAAVTLTGVFYVVIFNERISVKSIWVKKGFNFLGNISYPLYLTHLTLIKTLHKYNITDNFIIVSAALLLASVIYLAFDFYSKKRKVGATESSLPQKAVASV